MVSGAANSGACNELTGDTVERSEAVLGSRTVRQSCQWRATRCFCVCRGRGRIMRNVRMEPPADLPCFNRAIRPTHMRAHVVRKAKNQRPRDPVWTIAGTAGHSGQPVNGLQTRRQPPPPAKGCIRRVGGGGGGGGPRRRRAKPKLKSSRHRRRRSKLLAVSLKYWKGRRGIQGGLRPLLLRCTAVLIHHCPPSPTHARALAQGLGRPWFGRGTPGGTLGYCTCTQEAISTKAQTEIWLVSGHPPALAQAQKPQ